MITPETIAALSLLTVLEIILGIDNIIFLTVVVDKLPNEQQNKARILGLLLAMITRIGLLFSITWIMSLTSNLFTIFQQNISGRDIILIGGGLFLITKSTQEIHNSVNFHNKNDKNKISASKNFLIIIIQIAILDIIFSLDSIITAVGITKEFWIMATAITISVIIMMFSSKPIGQFIKKNPSFKILALTFLLLIGMTLIAEGFEFYIPKGYLYFSMAFSILIELLNQRMFKKTQRKNA